MTQNTSWLKKPDPVNLLRESTRPFLMQGPANSSIPLNGEVNRPYKPAPRKSCLMYQDRKLLVPLEKPKPKMPVRGHLPGRTSILPPKPRGVKSPGHLGAVRKSMAPTSRLVPRRRAAIESLLPQWAEDKMKAATPLHKSTPCDPIRSILKQRQMSRRPIAAKKVNFDAAPDVTQSDQDIAPLEESAIHVFLPAADPNPPTVEAQQTVPVSKPSVADAATNTDPPPLSEGAEDSVIFQHCAKKLNEFTRKITDILGEMREFQRVYKLDCTRSVFQSNLDEIQELSENVTPSVTESRSSQETQVQDTPSVTPSITVASTSAIANTNLPAPVVVPVPGPSSPAPSPEMIETENDSANEEPSSSTCLVPENKFYNSQLPSRMLTLQNKVSRSYIPTNDEISGVSSLKNVKSEGDEEEEADVSISEKENVGPLKEEADVLISEKENFGPLKETAVNLSPCHARRSARLKGHASPAAPLLAISGKSKNIKKKTISRFRLDDPLLIEEQLEF